MKKRLAKVLAEAGVASRRKAEELIAAGRVLVNGAVVQGKVCIVDTAVDGIEVDGKRIAQEKNKVCILLNKPKGCIVTVWDTHKRKTVMELLPNFGVRLYPVGRLDKDTTGLLLLTNDGELAYKLTHPKFGVIKTYRVVVKGSLKNKDLERLRSGIFVEGRRTAPAKVGVISENSSIAILRVQIHEGRKRQIREMFRAVGCLVKELDRIGYGNLKLKGLRRGQWRMVELGEI